MTAEQLIAFLQKCDPKAIVKFLIPDTEYSEYVEFVEFSLTYLEVNLCSEQPDYEEPQEDYQVNVLHKEDGFAKITITDL
jgi:hypothetical protein